MDIWDPSRIRTISSIMERASPHLKEGNRIRKGIEGDPCTPYRRAEDAARGTVKNVTRDEDGTVTFDAIMDHSGEVVRFDNRGVHAEKIWEIDPSYISTFKGQVDGEEEGEEEMGERDTPLRKSIELEEAAMFRGMMESRFDKLESRLVDLEKNDTDFRSTTASSIRYLAADLMNTSRGDPLEFSGEYADRYDSALSQKNEYRGEKKKNIYSGQKKTEDEVEPVTYYKVEEDGDLSD